jgi:hypothetical protein
MTIEPPSSKRDLKKAQIECDLAVVGGGLAGTCCAITAARQGLRVALIQDRPVLGGNGSSEIRLWWLGATAHMGNNARWSREGGVINELMVENLFRNPEGNPLIADLVLLEKVVEEKNITLLLNTAVFEVEKASPDRISAVRAFCSQNSTLYEVKAPLFCDASGDGIVGFLAGAAFRIGAEPRDEFGEAFAPTGEFGHLLGHSMYFYSKDTGRPVKFTAPSWALRDITKIPRYRTFNAKEHGCRLWWIEWGGRLDTVHETERIKWELWKVVYGVWDYIKNSGQFPEAQNLTLEWVGHIPGKRESRRFEGPYILRQQDVVERTRHYDTVAHGGWSIDLHPADGVYSALAGSHHIGLKGVYGIPYRCLYSRNIENLFLAGRIISATHVAFGTTRVMCTCAVGGQAVGVAAALALRHNLRPHDLSAPDRVETLRHELARTGQYILGHRFQDDADLARQATITASSTQDLANLPAGDSKLHLTVSTAQLLPLPQGTVPVITLSLEAVRDTTLHVELRVSERPDEFTPDTLLAEQTIALTAGEHRSLPVPFDCRLDQPRYVFLCLGANENIYVHETDWRVTGLVTLKRGRPERTSHVGGTDHEVWTPVRRPAGKNFALQCHPPVPVFQPGNVTNGIHRPTRSANAWVAALDDPAPVLTLKWAEPQTIQRIELAFDCDYDHAMETVLYGHPERVVPFMVTRYRILDAAGHVLHECGENHQAWNRITLPTAVTTNALRVEILETGGRAPAAIFEVRVYGLSR